MISWCSTISQPNLLLELICRICVPIHAPFMPVYSLALSRSHSALRGRFHHGTLQHIYFALPMFPAKFPRYSYLNYLIDTTNSDFDTEYYALCHLYAASRAHLIATISPPVNEPSPHFAHGYVVWVLFALVANTTIALMNCGFAISARAILLMPAAHNWFLPNACFHVARVRFCTLAARWKMILRTVRI